MRERRARFLLAVVSGLAAMLLAEAGLRVYDLARGRTTNARAFWYWLYEQDPYLGWRGRPRARAVTAKDDIRHDDAGFRDDRDVADLMRGRDAGRRLVVCVGESSTYGLTAGANDGTYPALLERELLSLSGSDRWVVFNAGMPGYTSHEVLGSLQMQILKLQPEIVVEMDLANDHDFMGLYLDSETDYNRLPVRLANLSRSPLRDLMMRSSLFALGASALRNRGGDDLGGRWRGPEPERHTARGLEFYLDNLAMTALLARRAGVRLMLVDQPIDYRGLTGTQVGSMEEMRSAMKDLAARERLPVLEAQSRLDWSGLEVETRLHLGRTGYERLAKILAPQILEAVAAPRGGAAGG